MHLSSLVFSVILEQTRVNYDLDYDFLQLYSRYSWCSERLIRDKTTEDHVGLSDMIPMKISHSERELPDGRWKPQLIVGHNVGFDRSFIREQYHIKVP